ncbi:MAG: hypothetical protein MK075_04830 [Phycisphaerales bacterium]|nr:hypothetical protein [Phycisphaerales bacterium]MEC8250689.1 hypothetical protein [Planctomycetota bacterium]
MTTSTRIGDLLCAAGELEPNELTRLLKLQKASPARPLGVLAEEHAGVDPAAVEAAWAAQMSQWSGRVDPRRLYPEKDAKQLVTPRRARQFNILPISRQGGRLSYCTTPLGLVSAHRFVTNVLGLVSEPMLAMRAELHEAIATHYPASSRDAA